MADFLPPSGPPPPKVPDGWKAQYNDQYKEWFFVNLHTRKSQWDRPTSPARALDDAPSDLPPSYAPSSSLSAAPTDTKRRSFESNNPYNPGGSTSGTAEDDAALAARLQAEEDARAGGAGQRGTSDHYYGQGGNNYGGSPGPGQPDLPPRPQDRGTGGKSGGFLSKLLGKASGRPSGSPQPGYGGGYGQQQGYGGYPPQQQGYYGGGQPGYGGYVGGPGYGPPGPGYGGYGGYGGYPPQQAQPARRTGGGLGTAGGAALGLGGGLLGGMLLADAFQGGDGGDYGDGGGGGDFGGGGGDGGGGF